MNVPLTPLRCLERAASLFARKTAVVCGERRFTYAEMAQRCDSRSVTVYIFSWAKGAYKTGFEDYPAFRFEDIPEPILEVYKSIGY